VLFSIVFAFIAFSLEAEIRSRSLLYGEVTLLVADLVISSGITDLSRAGLDPVRIVS
jgi:hypothetical protein